MITETLTIRDYCAGMEIYGPPSITLETTNFELVLDSAGNSGDTASTPWVIKIEKSLETGTSVFTMA